MTRPQESDFASHAAYSLALEGYCDTLVLHIRSCGGDCSEGLGKLAERVQDSNKAWAEYQNRAGIMRVFEDDAK